MFRVKQVDRSPLARSLGRAAVIGRRDQTIFLSTIRVRQREAGLRAEGGDPEPGVSISPTARTKQLQRCRQCGFQAAELEVRAIQLLRRLRLVTSLVGRQTGWLGQTSVCWVLRTVTRFDT